MPDLTPPAPPARPKQAFLSQPAKVEKSMSAIMAGFRVPFNSEIKQVPSKKKVILVLGLIFFLILVATLVSSFVKPKKTPPQVVTASPTLTPTPIPLISPEVFPDVTQTARLTPTPVINIIEAGWKSFTSQQGSFIFAFPNQLSAKPSNDLYHDLIPVIYEDSFYFDCINRQLGSSNPYACWLFDIEFTTGDLNTMLIGLPEYNQLPKLNNLELTSFIDKLGRTWTIRGPDSSLGDSLLYAQLAYNQVVYQLKTRVITRSMQNYLRDHTNQPFGFDVTTGTSPQDGTHIHELLAHEILSSFKPFNKPFITEPKWLQVRVSPNWSVAYPENWQLYRPGDLDLQSGDEGLLEGWYGNGDSVSFHKYSIRLTTPDISQFPASALKSLEGWKDYLLSHLTVQQIEQVEAVKIDQKKQKIKYDIYYLKNMPDQSNYYSAIAGLPDTNVHQAIFSQTEKLPRRMITIKQLDGLYEPQRMFVILDRFTKLLFE